MKNRIKRRMKQDLIYYMQAHQNRYNQRLHYAAFMFAFWGWIFLFIDVRVTIALGFLHYACSWIGHFCFEGNKPASFRYPLVGFYAGFIWFFIRTYEWATGKSLLDTYSSGENTDERRRSHD